MPLLSPLQTAFAGHRRELQGVAESTIRRDLRVVGEFLGFLGCRQRPVARIEVADIDAFLASCANRMVPKTLARTACGLRAFLRFLYMTGRMAHDLANAVATPRVRRGDTPPRALPWSDVRRILWAIDRQTRSGRRDYALLLTMVAYGLGAGEARGLTLESVNWRQRKLVVVRPKTARTIELPLLPEVARALAAYLRQGRPRHCRTRALFVRMHAPFTSLGSSSAIRHVLRKHAKAAGVSAAYLGSHVLRHSHATRQVDLATPIPVLGEILGHKRSESTSAYARVALARLRRLALPVPA
jgi:integrase